MGVKGVVTGECAHMRGAQTHDQAGRSDVIRGCYCE